MSPRPGLIVITGAPGSGKTTLAQELSRAIRCPRLSRDEIKEGMLQTLSRADAAPSPPQDIAWEVYDCFFSAIELMLSRRITLIAEAAFQHKLWSPKLIALRAQADIRIVVCALPLDLAATRHAQRKQHDPAREQFHPDPDPAALANYDPPHLDPVPTMTVDTSNGYAPGFDSIVAFAQSDGS